MPKFPVDAPIDKVIKIFEKDEFLDTYEKL
jgi:hypothetical protein